MKKEQNSWQDLPSSPTLFWDTDPDKIGLDTPVKTIIERVVSRGTWQEFKAVVAYYGKEKGKEVLTTLRYLDARPLSFCSIYFNIPVENFRCYTYKQSNPTHWNY